VSEDALPRFRYYADPIGDGRFSRSAARCDICTRARGWVFNGVFYSAAVDDPVMCPWCIADGSVAERWNGSFNETAAVIATARMLELCQRTPNMETWQDWEWPCHCDDAARYMGQPDGSQLRAQPAARDALLTGLAREGFSDPDAQQLVDSMGASPTAYHFRCLHCGTDIVTWDCD
jgi:uncharacterized protein CbrC (UPF0167 family)